MALPGSGTIRMAQIAAEFGGAVPHAIHEYYGKASGIPTSGLIKFSDFWGKSSGIPATTAVFWSGYLRAAVGSSTPAVYTNACFRVNTSGAQIGGNTALSVKTMAVSASGIVGIGIFAGALVNPNTQNIVRINISGNQVGSTTKLTRTLYEGAAFTLGALSMHFMSGDAFKINASGAQTAHKTIPDVAGHQAPAAYGDVGMLYGGDNGFSGTCSTVTMFNLIRRFNANSDRISTDKPLGANRSYAVGGSPDYAIGVFYSGSPIATWGTKISRINKAGALVGTTSAAGATMSGCAGTALGGMLLAQGGVSSLTTSFTNVVTRINSSGAIIGSQTHAGPNSVSHASAGIN